MKSVFWKISAVVSILLSSLGPHVAQGYLELEPVVETAVKAGPQLRVVSSESQVQINLVHTSVCSDSTESFDRFDLLLWSNCNFTLSLGRVNAPKLSVVTELPNLPQVTVARFDSHQLSHHAEFWKSHAQPDVALIAHSVSKTNSSIVSHLPASMVLAQEELDLVSIDSSQKYIVMRC